MIQTFILGGRRYAARGLAQARFAHDKYLATKAAGMRHAAKLENDARLARTQFHSK